MPTQANAINESGASGLVNFNGTATFSTAPLAQYSVVSGASANTINNITPSATSGVPVISQGSASQPIFGTAVVAGGGTGNTTQAAYSLVAGGTSTTGSFQAVGPNASGQVLASAGTSALPTFTAFPQVSGLGIGASPGSTAGLTFDGSNFMDNYAVGTYTPTVVGASSAGTTTYSNQLGQYVQIGSIVFAWFKIVITGATGTGSAQFSLPFTLNAASTNVCLGSFNSNGSGWSFGASLTYTNLLANPGNAFAVVSCSGSSQNAVSLQMANAANTMIGSIMFRV